MRVSIDWLQSYFDKKLPAPAELAERLTFYAYETDVAEDTPGVLEVDVLANRSSDSLCHRGVARELSTILDIPLKRDPLREPLPDHVTTDELRVEITEPTLAPRFMAALVRGVKVGPSPDWLRGALERIGQRSINNIVDATNYVMFDLGQPLHAFDVAKLADADGYGIRVRRAREGEKLVALNEEEYALDADTLVIVDANSDTPIGIAGIKGGMQSGIDESTRDIILEAAHFDYVSIRKSSQRLKLVSDASVRFQNDPSPQLPAYAMRDVIAMIQKVAGGTLEGVVDAGEKVAPPTQVQVPLPRLSSLLGEKLSLHAVSRALERLGIAYVVHDDILAVTPPFERTDLGFPEAIIEEIGRVHGYENVRSTPLPASDVSLSVDKRHFYSEAVRRALGDVGFSEVYTYTLRDRGDVQLANALASDKNFMRVDLGTGLKESLERNLYNAPLLGKETICIYELGPVWEKGRQSLHLAVGVGLTHGKPAKADALVQEAMRALGEALGVTLKVSVKDGLCEIDMDAVIAPLPNPARYEEAMPVADVRYRPISLYPFVLRDIALWVPEKTTAEEVAARICESAGELLVRHDQFDTFAKGDKVSFAFHLVFQSDERTLTDAEVGGAMACVAAAVKEKGWEVR